MIFGHRGFFGYAVRPGGETYWFSNFAQKEEPPRGALANADGDYRKELVAVHQDDPAEVMRILQACQDTSAPGRCTTSRRCRRGTAER